VLAGSSRPRERQRRSAICRTCHRGYEHTPFLERAFELRDHATFYDALYVALAECLACPL